MNYRDWRTAQAAEVGWDFNFLSADGNLTVTRQIGNVRWRLTGWIEARKVGMQRGDGKLFISVTTQTYLRQQWETKQDEKRLQPKRGGKAEGYLLLYTLITCRDCESRLDAYVGSQIEA